MRRVSGRPSGLCADSFPFWKAGIFTEYRRKEEEEEGEGEEGEEGEEE